MYTDPKKPLPIATEKKDYIGVVYNAIIEIGNARYNNVGNMESLEQRVAQEKSDAQARIDKFATDTDNDLKAHTNLRGAVHGETKETVGLGNVDNWPMANVAEHKAGQVKNKFAHPLGLAALVADRLTINPDMYIRSRILPLASGGNLGSIPQIAYRWVDGDVGDTLFDPAEYYGETGFAFATESGVRIYPDLVGTDLLTQVVASPGQPKTAITPLGGTQVRIYNRNIDVRRIRPSVLRGYSDVEPEGRLIKASDNLFDRSSLFYVEGTTVLARSFNKVRLPFDILVANNRNGKNWKGVLENRENSLYNIRTEIKKGNLGWGDDIYFTIKVDAFVFTDNGIDAKNGPGTSAETIATLGAEYTTKNYTVPANGKLHIYDHPEGGKAIAIKLRDMIAYTDAQRETLWGLLNTYNATNISFAWVNRLKGIFALRIPVGWLSKDKSKYVNYYVDLLYTTTENATTKTIGLKVDTLRELDSNIQILNDNLTVNKAGRFVESNGSCAGNPFDPRVFNGAFDANGGHVHVYTFYNRQYVGYYQHNVDSPLTWINNGDNITPKLEKYLFRQVSTINNDGFYGDHLRHIPVRQTDDMKNEYITLTRDWLNSYRWCYATVELDDVVAPVTAAGRNIGPRRLNNEWFEPPAGGIPSFVISNDENVNVIDSTPRVFNTQNKFKAYGGYELSSDVKNPIKFVQPLDLDDAILNWIAINGGGWTEGYKQMFLFRNQLFWFSQTTSANEMKPDGTDCYYGLIKNVVTETVGDRTVIKAQGDVAASATVKPLKVHLKKTLQVDRKTITGLDAYDATDVYIMRTGSAAGTTTRLCMVNLGPFNNFYFPFRMTNTSATEFDIAPVESGLLDPVFQYDPAKGFQVDYDLITAYGTKAPDRLHVNFQTPVMLNKMMWFFNRTPGSYSLISETRGNLVTNNGIMSNYEGTCVYPVGSIATIGGSNVPIKKPLIAHTVDYPNDELFVTMEGTTPVLYSANNNPANYPTEPNNGATPAGFTQDTSFRYYDIDGWKNALLPVIDSFRMNFYGYGSSFPAFMGTYGAGAPINRFFLQQKAMVVTWNTGVGRTINIGSGSGVTIKVNGQNQTYGGSGTFTIPGSFTGTVTVEIMGMSTFTWALGLVEIIQFGSLISSVNFAGCQTFKCTPSLPSRIRNYSSLFAGSTANTIPGMENWNTSNVTNMSGMFEGAVNFNQNLNNWKTNNVTNMSRMFKDCKVFNQALGNWDTSKVEDFGSMFENAVAFNQPLPWLVGRAWVFSKMFKGATAFNGNIMLWNVSTGKDFSSMFEDCLAFNVALQQWRPVSATTMRRMFKNCRDFNSQLTGWVFPTLLDTSEMFMGTKAFNRPLASWVMTSVNNTESMFEASVAFGADGTTPLTGWDMSNVVNAKRMFAVSNFNSDIENWKFGSDANLYEMFRGAKLFDKNVSTWDMRNVRDVSGMFKETLVFKQNILNWRLSSIVEMGSMFAQSKFSGDLVGWVIDSPNEINMNRVFSEASLFNGAGIATWNVSNAIDMQLMFNLAIAFNQDISNWDTGKNTTFFEMFFGAAKFNQPIGKWDVSSGVNFRNMLRKCAVFNQDLDNWNMSNATDISDIFREAVAFNGKVGTWDTSNVTAMNGTFVSCPLFNQDISGWDVSKVLNFTNTFGGCFAFNQDISGWNTESATIMDNMFTNAKLFNQDLSGWNVAAVTTHIDFATGATAWVLPKPNFPS